MITQEIFENAYEAYIREADTKDAVMASLASAYPLIRAQVLEEAATEAEKYGYADTSAKKIRSLKEQPK